MFLALKIKAYLLYTLPIVAPSWWAFTHYSGVAAAILSLFGGMVLMHIVITDDAKENHKNLRHLVMRKRHFDSLSSRLTD